WIISRPSGNHSRRYVSMKNPRSSPWMTGSTTTTSWMTSDSVTVAISPAPPLVELHLRVVAEHEPERVRTTVRPYDLDRAPDQRLGQPVDAQDAPPRQHDRVVELGVHHLAVGRDRGERADVAVHDARPLADDRRAPDPGPHDLAA